MLCNWGLEAKVKFDASIMNVLIGWKYVKFANKERIYMPHLRFIARKHNKRATLYCEK